MLIAAVIWDKAMLGHCVYIEAVFLGILTHIYCEVNVSETLEPWMLS